jgi:hypothetical protein
MAFTRILFCATFLFTATAVFAESLPFQRAIRLALSHSTEIAIAQADVKRAAATMPLNLSVCYETADQEVGRSDVL